MPRKRVRLERSIDEVITSMRNKLDELERPAALGKQDLRRRVGLLIELSYDLRELALHHLSGTIPAASASLRILEYLRLFAGESVDGEELDIVAGISEYPRRIREWRVEYGWPIKTYGTRYILERAEPDGEGADLWRVMNSVRQSGASARDRMLAIFKAFPGKVITTNQLRYVAGNVDMRRVRELRTELGWRINTRNTGRPELKPGEYVLVDAEQMEEHDRHIPDEVVVSVLARDGMRCQKAGCAWHPKDRVAGDPRQYIEVHHITWHSTGGSNESANLITLCNVHHKEVHREKVGPDAFREWLHLPI
jgi:hypothetical protein